MVARLVAAALAAGTEVRRRESGAVGMLLIGAIIGAIIVIVLLVQLIIPGDGD